MKNVIQVPLELVEAMADFRLPRKADKRLQTLMDRNTNGNITGDERTDLEALVVSEKISLVRAKALHLLRRYFIPHKSISIFVIRRI